MRELVIGDVVRIENNEIFQCMGYRVVTGKVTYINGSESFGFACNQTGAMECCDFGDGVITVSGVLVGKPIVGDVKPVLVSDDFGDRMQRIRNSLETINALIAQNRRPVEVAPIAVVVKPKVDDNVIGTDADSFGC